MNTILITGGAGYIGSVISNLALQKGFKVKVIDTLWFRKDSPLVHWSNPHYKFIKGDICNEKLVDDILDGVDYIVHTAAVVGEPASKKYPQLTLDVNQKASFNLITKASQRGVKGFIFFSTCSNYGVSEGQAFEDSTLKPLSPYAETKVNVEKYLMSQSNGIDWVIGRLATVYGSSYRMRFDLTVNDFTMNAYTKKYLEVFMPYTYRPYIHTFDVANTVLEIINKFDKVKNNVFNVGFNGENYQKVQIVEEVKKLLPELTVKIVDKGSDLRDYQVDFSKLQKYIGIKNVYTVKDGVKEIIDLLSQGVIKDPLNSVYYNTTPEL